MNRIFLSVVALVLAVALPALAVDTSSVEGVAVQDIEIWNSRDGGFLVYIATNKSDLSIADVTPIASDVEVPTDDGSDTRMMPLLTVAIPMPLAIEDGERAIKKGFLDSLYWWQGKAKGADYTSVQFLVENGQDIRYDFWIVENKIVVALLPEVTVDDAGRQTGTAGERSAKE